jgi:hypothetical protein
MSREKPPEVEEYLQLKKDLNKLYRKAGKATRKGEILMDGIRRAGLVDDWNRINDRINEIAPTYWHWENNGKGIVIPGLM